MLSWIQSHTRIYFSIIIKNDNTKEKKKRCQLGRPRMKKWREEIVILGYVQFEVLWDILVETSSRNCKIQM